VSDCTRREFHALLLRAAAAGALAGCGPFDGSAPLANGQVMLPFSQFPALRGAGGAAVVDVTGSFPIVVVRQSASQAAALSATCTHRYCILRYASDRQDVYCDCHDADFALDGSVLGGPTSIPLPTYAASVTADGITVDVSP
jgi:nitrite reductase/ring-hydroxylating ferredoxin subunit